MNIRPEIQAQLTLMARVEQVSRALDTLGFSEMPTCLNGGATMSFMLAFAEERGDEVMVKVLKSRMPVRQKVRMPDSIYNR